MFPLLTTLSLIRYHFFTYAAEKLVLHVLNSRLSANVAWEKTWRTHHLEVEQSSYGQTYGSSLPISWPRCSWRHTQGNREPAPAATRPGSPWGLGASAGTCRSPRGSHRRFSTEKRISRRHIHRYTYARLCLPTLASRAIASGSASAPAGEGKHLPSLHRRCRQWPCAAPGGGRAEGFPPPRARGARAEAHDHRLRLARAPSRLLYRPSPPCSAHAPPPIPSALTGAPARPPGVPGDSVMAAPCGRFLHMGWGDAGSACQRRGCEPRASEAAAVGSGAGAAGPCWPWSAPCWGASSARRSPWSGSRAKSRRQVREVPARRGEGAQLLCAAVLWVAGTTNVSAGPRPSRDRGWCLPSAAPAPGAVVCSRPFCPLPGAGGLLPAPQGRGGRWARQPGGGRAALPAG